MRRRKAPPKITTISFGFQGGKGRQPVMETADQHNEIEINFVERGEIVLRRGTETLTLLEGTTAIYWAAVPHQVIAVKPRTEISWFVVPLAWFLAWKLPATFNKRVLGGEMLVLKKKNFRARLPAFSEWAREMSGSRDMRVAVKLEIEAFFRRLAVNSSSRASFSKRVAPVSEEYQCRHVERMARTINERFREALSVREIAQSAGLSPEYAMRLFRSRWGVTLWTFVLQQRISEAKRLLLLSDATIVEISGACGFQSLGRFYHAFQTQCHCSPGAYRRSQLGVN